MERIEFLVEGSSGNEYKVVFEIDEGVAHAYCDCQAGQNGLYCKHRIEILGGDVSYLVSNNGDDVERLRRLLLGTALDEAYDQFIAADSEFNDAKNRLNRAKKNLSRAMYR